ncbi:MAG: tRNA uridine-5-carboxymethylaminomethyl(34) synthesis GTPase MnmE [Candidatus Firestonebacteria bacterium]|nr:tRNA uridine-5-carboxymethylaminomethyl(34) synthesis GTPase MnmE [Candidatus Firestonebacteria bacterium]
MKLNDTITAISTPSGEGGIGIVRISGVKAINIIQKIFKPHKRDNFIPRTHTISYGMIINPETKESIDEVLVSIMLAPFSYTKEDVAEINCHGGIIPLNRILKLVILMGARLAEPGEFTKRAFLNGRIDLAQAEAVIDVIRAKTEKSLREAQYQLEGRISNEISYLRDILIDFLSRLELSVDFIEEDIEIVSYQEIHKSLVHILDKIEKLLKSVSMGKIIKEGIKIAIVGRPNVGKSSLLNSLLNEDRAIVTNFPGTTRDCLEEILEINGIPAVIIDTAGIRKTGDEIEQAGIERTRRCIKRADIVLLLFDISEPFHEEDLNMINEIKDKKVIFVLNKIDKKNIMKTDNLPALIPQIKISVLNDIDIDKLKNVIYNLIALKHIDTKEEVLINNLRHEEALKSANISLNRALLGIQNKLSPEFIAQDVKEAAFYLGSIIGKTYTEDILNNIFSNFCIGK